MTTVGVYVPVSAIFPELSFDFDAFGTIVRKLSRTDAMFWCARINLILTNPRNKHLDAQRYAVAHFFEPPEVSRLEKFVSENGGPDSVLFEIKGTLIREKDAADTVEGGYIQAFLKAYAAPKSPDSRALGAGQLARAIQGLAIGQYVPIGFDFEAAKTIYPVIIVYDISLTSPGHAEILADEFVKLLAPDELLPHGYVRKGRFVVAPISLMTVEDLEVLQSSIRNFRLVDLLRDYTNATSDGRRPSLRDFLNAARSKYKLLASWELADRASAVLKQAMDLLFVSSSDAQ